MSRRNPRMNEERRNHQKSKLSSLLYLWVSPIIQISELMPFNKSFHQNLPEILTSESAFKKMSTLWTLHVESENPITLEKCFFDLYKKYFVKLGLQTLLYRLILLLIPLILRKIVHMLDDEHAHNFGFVNLLFWFALIKLGLLLLRGQINKNEVILKIQFENTLSTIILNKLLKMSANSVLKINRELLLERIKKFSQMLRSALGDFYLACILPIEIIFVCLLIGSCVGWTLLYFFLIVLGIEKLLSVFEFKRLNLKMEIEKSDRSRISGICEYFGQMKQAKKCGYENFILSKLYLNFQKSTKLTNRLKMLEIITLIIKIIRPFLIYLFCLWRFLEKGNQLKLEIALPFILVAEIGQKVFSDLINLFRRMKPGFRALSEIKEFLTYIDDPLENYHRNDIPSEKLAISITEGSFSWQNPAFIKQPGAKPTLKNLSISIKHGAMVGIIGDAGAGKSSLFSAILGGMNIYSTPQTKISISGTIGYVNQSPVFQSCTIKDHILQGRPYDSSRFKRVVRGTTLNKDLVHFPKGYETDIGESGFALTAQQKVKIALAQIAYKNADILLLDGVLDLFDGDEYKKFFEDCIQDLFREKTRVIISKDPAKWSLIDYLYIFQDGFIVHRGPYDVLCKYPAFKALENKLHRSTNFTKTKVPSFIEFEIAKSYDDIFDEPEDSIRVPEFPETSRSSRNDMSVISESGIELVPLTRSISRDISPQITAPISFKFTPEADNEGLMRGDNRYETLTNFINFMPFLSLLIVKLISAALLIFFFYYISAWAGFHLVGGVPNSGYVKTVFTLAVVYVCMRVFNIYQVKICLGVSARRLHIVMLKVFSNCPLADLFQQIPINTVSDSLGWKFENIDGKGWKNLESLLDNFFNTWIILLVVLMYSSPVILTCLILSCLFISRRRRIFMRFLRGLVINDLKIKNEREACFDYIFTKIIEIKRSNEEDSIFNRFHDLNNRNSQNKILANGSKMWLDIRVNLVILFFVLVTWIQMLLFQRDSQTHHIIGLLLVLLINFDAKISELISSIIEAEPLSYSIESCAHIFEQIPTQEDTHPKDPVLQKKLNYWPIDGDIISKRIFAKIPGEDDNCSLKLDFIIKGGQKVGVLANDRKYTQAFFDLILKNILYSSGDLIIDGIKLADLDSSQIKTKISIISSEPFIISGTLKENIDLESQFNKEQIWSIIQMISLKNLLQEKGFEFKVESDGRNLSPYDKIAISIIRAILSKKKIILVEDLDVIMNEKIQKLMEDLFKSLDYKTFIISSKKFDYLLKFDRIITLYDGRLIDFDTPINLLAKDNSYFKKLLNFYN